jgi:hypothetical protein
MKKNDKKTKTKAPDFFADAVYAVSCMDDVRLKRKEGDYEELHKRAIKAITVCNNVLGKGFISISKARQTIEKAYRDNKVKLADKKAV